MVMNRTELVMARRQVDAEIKSDPIVVNMVRRTKIDVPGGGWRWSPPTQGPDIECLIMPTKRRMSEMQVNTEMGDIVDYSFILLARHDADIKRDDTFTWEGDQFEVQQVHIKEQVSVTAMIDYFGGAKNG